MGRVHISLLLVVLVCLQNVFAHFTLNYPATRGFNEDEEATAPCGNFNKVGNRSEFPLSGGFLEIYSGHTSYSYTVNVVVGNSGNVTSSNVVAIATGTRSYPDLSCLAVDLTKDADIKDGVNGTIQVTFNGGDGLLYQCTDVTFVSKASSWNSSACVNADGSSTSSAADPTQSTSGASDILPYTGLVLAVGGVAAAFLTSI